MLEYTNLGSQILKTIDIVNSSKNITDDKEKKAKFLPVVLYIMMFVSAALISYNYFENVEGFAKWVLIALACIFNGPFLLYYAIWYVQLNKGKPGRITKIEV